MVFGLKFLKQSSSFILFIRSSNFINILLELIQINLNLLTISITNYSHIIQLLVYYTQTLRILTSYGEIAPFGRSFFAITASEIIPVMLVAPFGRDIA